MTNYCESPDFLATINQKAAEELYSILKLQFSFLPKELMPLFKSLEDYVYESKSIEDMECFMQHKIKQNKEGKL